MPLHMLAHMATGFQEGQSRIRKASKALTQKWHDITYNHIVMVKEIHMSNLDTRSRKGTPNIEERNREVTLKNNVSIRGISHGRPMS